MTATLETTTTTTAEVPTHCNQPMRPKEAFVTQRTFYRCTVCSHNDYSVGAFTKAHTARS